MWHLGELGPSTVIPISVKPVTVHVVNALPDQRKATAPLVKPRRLSWSVVNGRVGLDFFAALVFAATALRLFARLLRAATACGLVDRQPMPHVEQVVAEHMFVCPFEQAFVGIALGATPPHTEQTIPKIV